MKLKQKLFNKMLSQPITDLTIVTYELYKNSCLVYLQESDVLSYEEYCILVKEKLEKFYNGEA